MKIALLGWETDYELIEVKEVTKIFEIKNFSPNRLSRVIIKIFRKIFNQQYQHLYFYHCLLIGISKHDLILVQDSSKFNKIVENFPEKSVVIFRNLIRDSTKSLLAAHLCFTFDKKDAEKYNIRLYNQYIPSAQYIRERDPKILADISFFGRDKNREKELKDIRSLKNKNFLNRIQFTKSRSVSYDEYIKAQFCGRVALEITQRHQTAPSMRLIEAFALKRKVLSNNKLLFDFLDSYEGLQNVFIIDRNSAESEIQDFIKKPFQEVSEKFIEQHEAQFVLSKIINEALEQNRLNHKAGET